MGKKKWIDRGIIMGGYGVAEGAFSEKRVDNGEWAGFHGACFVKTSRFIILIAGDGFYKIEIWKGAAGAKLRHGERGLSPPRRKGSPHPRPFFLLVATVLAGYSTNPRASAQNTPLAKGASAGQNAYTVSTF